MDIINKIKTGWTRFWGNAKKSETKHRTQTKRRTESAELGADTVIKAQLSEKPSTGKRRPAAVAKKPSGKACRAKQSTGKTSCAKKTASKRTRPTNADYRMIDTDCDTADAGKS